jgi:hypothetical protein
LGEEENTSGGGHVVVGAGVHVPLRRWWRSERHSAEHDDESVLIPQGAGWSRDTAEELVAESTKAGRRASGTEA